MSSHHIVRDEQEPALLIWQAGQATWEQVGELLEWSPRVIVHQQALAEALQWHIKLDAVWAGAGQLQQVAEAVAHQAPVALKTFSRVEDALSEVASWLKTINQHSLNLLVDALADDYAMLRQAALLHKQLQLQLISQGWRYSYFRSGMARKWVPQGSRLKLISFGGKAVADKLSPAADNTTFTGEEALVREIRMQQAGMVNIAEKSPFWLGEQL